MCCFIVNWKWQKALTKSVSLKPQNVWKYWNDYKNTNKKVELLVFYHLITIHIISLNSQAELYSLTGSFWLCGFSFAHTSKVKWHLIEVHSNTAKCSSKRTPASSFCCHSKHSWRHLTLKVNEFIIAIVSKQVLDDAQPRNCRRHVTAWYTLRFILGLQTPHSIAFGFITLLNIFGTPRQLLPPPSPRSRSKPRESHLWSRKLANAAGCTTFI